MSNEKPNDKDRSLSSSSLFEKNPHQTITLGVFCCCAPSRPWVYIVSDVVAIIVFSFLMFLWASRRHLWGAFYRSNSFAREREHALYTYICVCIERMGKCGEEEAVAIQKSQSKKTINTPTPIVWMRDMCDRFVQYWCPVCCLCGCWIWSSPHVLSCGLCSYIYFIHQFTTQRIRTTIMFLPHIFTQLYLIFYILWRSCDPIFCHWMLDV